MRTTDRKLLIASLACMAISVLLLLANGCSSTAPRKWETNLFDVTTNVTPVVVYQTNTVAGETVVIFKTNYVVDYQFTTKTNTSASLQTASNIAGIFNPAAGSLVSLLGAGILGLWARLRSSSKTSVALAQGIEVAREVMLKLPKGTEYDAAYTTFLKNHQRELGVLTGVGKILENNVNVPAAQSAAAGISAVVEALEK